MLAYTYYTKEDSRPTAKLTARNFRRVFENEFVLVKIKPLSINRRYDNTLYCVSRHGHIENISSVVRHENIRLFKRLEGIPLDDRINTPELGNCSYLLFEKYRQDGCDRYKCSLTTGGADQLAALMTRPRPPRAVVEPEEPVVVHAPHRRTQAPRRVIEPVAPVVEQEVEEPVVRAYIPNRSAARPRAPRRVVVDQEVDDSPEEPLVPMRTPRRVVAEQPVPARAKAKVIKFTTNTDCYICMMDFTEDPDVTMNSCCYKQAHTACYSGILNKSSCPCCRAELE